MRWKTATLGLLRHGQRKVSWVPDWMGWGNNVYQWLWSYQGVRQGENRRALLPDRHSSWVEVFPAARALLLKRDEVRFRDQRVTPWVEEDRGTMLSGIDDFVRDCMLPGSGVTPGHPEQIVVNIRRGDYYSDPSFRKQFGFPIETYVRKAMTQAIAEGGTPRSIHVVSDGPEWCRQHLDWLSQFAPVTHEDETRRTPESDLRVVAGAQRLIITNSTFSYWAAYIGDGLHLT